VSLDAGVKPEKWRAIDAVFKHAGNRQPLIIWAGDAWKAQLESES
jgi:hypothetical protein